MPQSPFIPLPPREAEQHSLRLIRHRMRRCDQCRAMQAPYLFKKSLPHLSSRFLHAGVFFFCYSFNINPPNLKRNAVHLTKTARRRFITIALIPAQHVIYMAGCNGKLTLNRQAVQKRSRISPARKADYHMGTGSKKPLFRTARSIRFISEHLHILKSGKLADPSNIQLTGRTVTVFRYNALRVRRIGLLLFAVFIILIISIAV